MEQKTTLYEIDTHYDIVDLLDLNEALDLRDETIRRSEKEAARRMKKK